MLKIRLYHHRNKLEVEYIQVENILNCKNILQYYCSELFILYF